MQQTMKIAKGMDRKANPVIWEVFAELGVWMVSSKKVRTEAPIGIALIIMKVTRTQCL